MKINCDGHFHKFSTYSLLNLTSSSILKNTVFECIFPSTGAYFRRLIQPICHHETLDFKNAEKTINFEQNFSKNLIKEKPTSATLFLRQIVSYSKWVSQPDTRPHHLIETMLTSLFAHKR